MIEHLNSSIEPFLAGDNLTCPECMLDAMHQTMSWRLKFTRRDTDVGALGEKLERNRTVVRLVNLNSNESRKLIVQAGVFGEHRFGTATYLGRASECPGESGGLRAPS